MKLNSGINFIDSKLGKRNSVPQKLMAPGSLLNKLRAEAAAKDPYFDSEPSLSSVLSDEEDEDLLDDGGKYNLRGKKTSRAAAKV